MDEANKTALANFPETVTWRSLRPIDTPVVEPQNEFAGARSPTVPDDSDVQVPVNHEFSETFQSKEFDGKSVGKGERHNLVNHLCKLQSQDVF